MRKQLDFLVQYEEEFQGWQRRSSGKFTICYLVFLRKRRRWAFLNTLQALDPPTFKTFGLTFLRKRLWASLICSKTARYRLFLAVVRCCVTTTLAAETFSLLSVYLNYKFGLGLPSFYLFFSFFELILTTSVGYKKRLCYRWPVLDCECEKMTDYLKLLRRRLFQPIEFSLAKFDRLDPSYQTSKARIR